MHRRSGCSSCFCLGWLIIVLRRSRMPSPEGKVARRKPGRMRNGDAVGYRMQSVKMVECLKFHLFNYLRSGFQMSPFLISQALRPASFPPGLSVRWSKATYGHLVPCAEAIAPAALSSLNNNLGYRL